ncbi:DNA mismatch repair protein MutL [Phanerochaete sordida]|uniref:DNA mismatch repair protein MutL n=1 Tax=Phanerochaete sordida TaxID=48140 RepID=A0A9P3G1R2_9APHY|nr:DNA mismatch repair protein MutL [Phanerochaete sordida]
MAADHESAASNLNGPKPIRRLEEAVINRIAAGEIIHRPSSALKELLENCLDAGATSIRVTAKDGGMKLLQVQDNGSGIRKADLLILAERFTTSKISSFKDLERLTTYGFRGEALASVSYVSQLSVVTKTKSDTCAWKATYVDGRLASKDGSPAEPKACAGNDGTIINVENLFYNTPTRLSSLRGSSEEYSRILDVVTKYAVHNPHVSFTCKKSGSSAPDITTPSGSSVKQAIGQLYGQTIAKELLETKVSSNEDSSMVVDEAEEAWAAEVFFTSPNYQAKKMVFLLFINHRLVESPRIKKALETIYTGILPKGASPFVYLSLQIDPRSVDVNVHPTKREVHFLDEEQTTQKICDAVHAILVGQNQSKTFEYQTLLTGSTAPAASQSRKGKERARREDEDEPGESSSPAPFAVPAPVKKLAPNHKVRTSQQDRTLDSMFPVLAASQQPSINDADSGQRVAAVKVPEIVASECNLASVLRLRQEVERAKHEELAEILQKHVFVGIVDLGRCLSLVQHSKKLYLVNHGALAEEFFYQLGLLQFGDYHRIKLEPPPPLQALVELAVEAEDTSESKLSKADIVDVIVETLLARREMLKEYFSLEIDANGYITSLPLLLKDYTPNLDKLPLLLMRLGPQVNWHSEQECFESFLRELAFFYVPEPLVPGPTEAESADAAAMRWQIQHVLFPAMARYLLPPKTLVDRDVVQVAHLPELYRVFERC